MINRTTDSNSNNHSTNLKNEYTSIQITQTSSGNNHTKFTKSEQPQTFHIKHSLYITLIATIAFASVAMILIFAVVESSSSYTLSNNIRHVLQGNLQGFNVAKVTESHVYYIYVPHHLRTSKIKSFQNRIIGGEHIPWHMIPLSTESTNLFKDSVEYTFTGPILLPNYEGNTNLSIRVVKVDQNYELVLWDETNDQILDQQFQFHNSHLTYKRVTSY